MFRPAVVAISAVDPGSAPRRTHPTPVAGRSGLYSLRGARTHDTVGPVDLDGAATAWLTESVGGRDLLRRQNAAQSRPDRGGVTHLNLLGEGPACLRCSSATTIRLITVDSKELEEILM